MAEVVLSIGDRQYRIACRDGSEDQVLRMGLMIESRWGEASRASGGNNAERSMLFVALMLADALDEAQSANIAPPPAEEALSALADRLEALAAALEEDAPNA